MKNNWLYFLGYMFFTIILSIGIGTLFNNFSASLIIIGVFGLLYIIIVNTVNYINNDNNK